LTEEHSTLTQKNKGDKRTRVILGCYECMEKQDMIIETFLELIGSRPTLESELKEKLDKGPPRLRVPTREELKFELAKIQAEYNEIDSKFDKKYSEYNP
jgi:hypothetical protein